MQLVHQEFWKNNGFDIRNHPGSRPQSLNYAFNNGFTWSNISSGNLSCRLVKGGMTFDSTGPMGFPYEINTLYHILAMLNSKVCQSLLQIIEPTMHYSVGSIQRIPFILNKKEKIDILAHKCVYCSKSNWDSYETSWDFKRHPLI